MTTYYVYLVLRDEQVEVWVDTERPTARNPDETRIDWMLRGWEVTGAIGPNEAEGAVFAAFCHYQAMTPDVKVEVIF